MSGKENPILGNKEIYPSDEVLASHIGDNMEAWKKVLEHASENYNEITGEWRYYNDGKQWLYKLQYKKKTVFWAGVKDNAMRITFYFGNKAEPAIQASSLPFQVKDEYMAAKPFSALKPITLRLDESADTMVVFELIRIKTLLK